MMIYRAKDGSPLNDEKATVVAAEMTRLDPEGEGVSARTFHLSQEPEEAPLHPDFEWDNATAACLYRDEQARHLIRSVVLVAAGASGESHEVRAFLAVTGSGEGDPEEQKVYRPLAVVMSSEPHAQEIETDAMRQLKGWRDRWRSYADIHTRFSRVFAVIDEALGDAAD